VSTVFTVRSLQVAKPGRHRIEPNLYLEVSSDGRSRRFLLRFVSPITHRATEAGLGTHPTLSLSGARAKASEMRAMIAKGVDPIVQKREARAAKIAAQKTATTFDDALRAYVEAFRDKGAPTIELDALLRRHVAALLSRRLTSISTGDVLASVQPVQATTPKTAARARAAIATVFDYALARNMFTGANPASRDVFKFLLPAAPKSTPHRMMPFADVPDFVARLQASPSASKLCLAFLILTATRSKEAIRATWDEIDTDARTWAIPASRMKMRRAHKIPLSNAAIDVLTQARDMFGDAGFVFPGATKGSPMCPRVLETLLHKQLHEPYAVHGFRASFSTWANETQSFAYEDVEACLTHLTGNAVSRAYDRAEKIAKRAAILQAWGDYVMGTSSASNVVQLVVAART
jgi:integrase